MVVPSSLSTLLGSLEARGDMVIYLRRDGTSEEALSPTALGTVEDLRLVGPASFNIQYL